MSKPYLILDLGKRHLIKLDHLECIVTVEVYFDECADLNWDYASEVERKAFERKVERGDITPSGVVVIAKALGLEGQDSLWGVLVEKETDIHNTISEHDMVNNACGELLKSIQVMAKNLAPFMKGQNKS